MTYWHVNVIFLGFAALIAVVAIARHKPGKVFCAAGTMSTAMLFVLTAVFDNLLIFGGIISYTDQNISGLRVGLAPLEDFAYPLGGVILLPAVWLLLGGRLNNHGRTRHSEEPRD